MFKFKRLLAMILSAALIAGVLPASFVLADGTGQKVVTLGADLSADQKNTMLQYFGIEGQDIKTLTVKNSDERKYLSDYVSLDEIGTKTYSCALVKPTNSGGIQVKTANLTWVTSNMIASTLATCGVANCQVLAASPFAVSGTGALTGVIMSYESASGKKLNKKRVRAATRELITTARLGDRIGPPRATFFVNRAKRLVIERNVTSTEEITEIVNNISNEYNISLSVEDTDLLVDLLEEISALDYDIAEMEETLERVEENAVAEIDEIDASDIETLQFEAEAESEAEDESEEEEEDTENILLNTDDAALGEDAVFDATEEDALAEETVAAVPEDPLSIFPGNTGDETESAAEAEEIAADDADAQEDAAAPASADDIFDSIFAGSESAEDETESSKPSSDDDIFDSIFEDGGSEEAADDDAAPASDDDIFDSIFADGDSAEDAGSASDASSDDDLFDSLFEDSYSSEDAAGSSGSSSIDEMVDQVFEYAAEMEAAKSDDEDDDSFDAAEDQAESTFTISELKLSPKDETVEPELDCLEIKCSSKELDTGSGTLTIYEDDGTKVEEISLSDDEKVDVWSDEVDVYFDTMLSGNTAYYVILSDDALKLDGASLKASSKDDWKFSTSEAEKDFEEE